ncbi:MAG TPA: GAF domain-containing protein [Actinomycetota bacterium]|nr:GAF domain-containing protein [Actinomycetota bacterium]
MSDNGGPIDQPRLDELTALYRVAALSNVRGDMPAIVNEILRLVSDLVSCRNPALFLFDEEASEMNVHFQDPKDDTTMNLSDCGLVRRVYTSRNAEYSNDISGDPDGNALAVAMKARHIAGAPLTLGDNVLGVLTAVHSERGAFTQSDIRLISILADRAALTIENSRLMTTLERQVQELESLQRLSRLLTTSDSLEYVISESVRIVTEAVDCEKAAILLYDPVENALIAREPVYGLNEKEVEALRVPLSEPSLAGTVFRTNTPLSSNDAVNDAWVSSHFREILGIKTLAAIPLTTGPRPIGILKAINARKGFFRNEDVRLLSLLGAQVGSVIEAMQARDRERGLMSELREVDRTRSEFISMLAHELRGPMTTVMGFGYTLRDNADKIDEEKKIQIISTIVREVERLSRMVSDLLDLSRMEAGTVKYDLEPVELKEFTESLVQTHGSLRADHLVQIEVPDDIPKILADRDRLHQVLINLLTNATRYSPEGTMITVGAVPDGDQVSVSVTDQGIGISGEDVDRIFEKFAMLPKPAWVKKGTGLGLFITRGIVEAMGGRVWVESEQGKGTTMGFTIPRADGA